jgi:hypothetical protein
MFPAAEEPALQEMALNLKSPALGGNVKLAAFFPPVGSAVPPRRSQGEEPVLRRAGPAARASDRFGSGGQTLCLAQRGGISMSRCFQKLARRRQGTRVPGQLEVQESWLGESW